MRKGKNIIRSY